MRGTDLFACGENRIKKGRNALHRDKTDYKKFDTGQARLKMGLVPYTSR
jgi:hypothetical protein